MQAELKTWKAIDEFTQIEDITLSFVLNNKNPLEIMLNKNKTKINK